MLAQQSRIDARLSNAIVDEVGFPAAPAIMNVCWVSSSMAHHDGRPVAI